MVKEWEYYFLHLFSTKVVKFAPKPPPHRYYSNTKTHEHLQSPLDSKAGDH